MPPLLLEREDAIDRMRAALVRARAGMGCTLLVSGEAGIGKTTLLDHFVKDPISIGYRVLWGSCESLYTPRTLGPLADFAAQLGPAIGQALREADNPSAIFSAILADLAASDRPSLIVMEDVHWADHATLDLIKFLGRRIGRVAALLVLTYRDESLPAGHPLLAVLGELPAAHTERLPLAALSRESVLTLGALSGGQVAGLFEKTGGNPFFVTEVLASNGEQVPRTIHEAVMARLRHLSAAAILLCERASVFPGRVERALLLQLSASLGQEADDALDACVQAGVLQEVGDDLRFRHELARLVVQAGLLPQRRRSVHAAVLQLQLGNPASLPARMVFHASQAGRTDLVLALAPKAAQDAARMGAHREAAAHLAHALQHAAGAPLALQAELLEKWSFEAGISQTVNDEVIAARQRAVDLWARVGNPERMGLNLRWLSRLHWYRGEKDLSESCLQRAIDVLESMAPTAELAMAYSARSQMYMLTSNTELARSWSTRALAVATETDATEARIHALNNLGSTLLMAGEPGGEALLEESLASALAGNFHEQAARAYTNLSSSMVLQCRFDEAERYCREGLAFDRDHDLDSWTYYLQGLCAQVAAERGHFAAAQTLALEALAVPHQSAVMRWPPSLALGIARSRRGEGDAMAILEACLVTSLAVGEAQLVLPTCRALAEGYWQRGLLEQAKGAVLQGWAYAAGVDGPWLIGQLRVWGHRLGLALAEAGPIAPVYQLEMEGHALHAARQWQALGARFEAALCLMRSGGTDLREAADVFAELDAPLALDLTRLQARAEGVRGVKRGPYAAARDNELGLTAREVQIHHLLASGMSNAEISSRLHRSVRTVEHHVSQVLAKLGVKTRSELRKLPEK